MSIIKGRLSLWEEGGKVIVELNHKHDWQEEYYGYECRCGGFIPYGSEPWLPEDEDICDDPTMHRTCETCGGEFWDGGCSCTCDEVESDTEL